ncbi:MAG: hypothetical protein GFH27_549367n39 [Chloroflexi bacterium AL-W]|nr:hypothetical protein [Chloroflexi bacterium AL-W]
MEPAFFHQMVKDACGKPPAERHEALLYLHRVALDDYLEALSLITPERAAENINIEGDTRTVQQIVGHIGEWARYELLAGADILVGIKNPRGVIGLERYLMPTGRAKQFKSVDEVNAYFAKIHAQWTWAQILTFADEMARALYTLFATPGLLNAERLEATHEHVFSLDNGEVITGIHQGWVLWLMEIKHIAVSHRAELRLP